MDVQEYNNIMNEEIEQPMSWIGNYFYNSGKYTVQGSPYSELGNKTQYKLNEWLDRIDWKKKPTILFALALAVEFGYLVPFAEGKKTDGSVYNLMCGRSSYRQRVLDAVVGQMIKNHQTK